MRRVAVPAFVSLGQLAPSSPLLTQPSAAIATAVLVMLIMELTAVMMIATVAPAEHHGD